MRWQHWLIVACSGLSACNNTTDTEERAAKGHEAHEREADEHEGREMIELTPQVMKNVTIRTNKVTKRTVVSVLDLPAEVRPHPDKIAHITPLVASQVAEVKVKPGDKVKRGDLLAVLKNVQLGEARADLAQARAALEVAKDQLARQQQLMDAGIGAQKSYVEAQGAVKQARAALSAAASRAQVYGGSGGSGATTVLKSPLDGTVVARHATAGEVANPERELFVIADIDTVWVVGRAYESDLASVQLEASALVRVKAYPERTWQGIISYISPTLDERTRTAEVRVELENHDAALKPGMFATLMPTSAGASKDHKASATLAVPTGAVQRDGQRFLAFVAKGAGRFEPRQLTIGKRGAEYVEVLSGLSEGEPVVVEGTFILKSEAAKHELGGGHSH